MHSCLPFTFAFTLRGKMCRSICLKSFGTFFIQVYFVPLSNDFTKISTEMCQNDAAVMFASLKCSLLLLYWS